MTYCKTIRKLVCNYKGKKIDIPYLYGVSRSTYYNWRNNTSKIRKKITPEIKCYMRSYVIKRVNFNYKLLIKSIRINFSISISKSSIYNILKQMNLTKKKINRRLVPSKKSDKKNKFKNKIKPINLDNIISIDETSIDTHLSHNYGWSVKGKRIVKKIKATKYRYTLICGISNKKVINTRMVKNSANGESFIKFLEDLIKKLQTTKKYYLLLDNARIHHTKKLKDYINSISNIEIIYNVPYMPEYNPIEYVFNDLKKYLRNFIITKSNIMKKVGIGIKKVNKNNLIKYYNNSLLF